MNCEFLVEARDEFQEAALYYEARVPGLGNRFKEEINRVIKSIAVDPYRPRERGGYRRINCPVFTYYVAYIVRGDKIVIAAVAHGHRKPAILAQRI